MKTSLWLCLLLLVTDVVAAQETMTPERFKQLVATPGDNTALRPELASLPFWKNSKCNVTMKWQNGKIFKEDCLQTSKTIGGKYLVFTTESKFYNRTMYAVGEYDEKASAIRLWGLYENTLTQATMVVDLEKKISASTSNYGDFMEISVGSCSANEMSDHTLVYKNGVLFMTRDVKAQPLAATNSVPRTR